MVFFNRNILLVLLLISFTNIVKAGVPVSVIANVQGALEHAQSMAQFIKEFDQIVKQYEQMVDQYDLTEEQGQFYQDMVNNHWTYEDVINDFNKNNLINDNWDDIYSNADVSALRYEFGLNSDNPTKQNRFDNELKNYQYMEDTYQKIASRQQRIYRLSSELKGADTPAKKADLQNSLATEQVQLKNDQLLASEMNKLMVQKKELEIASREEQFKNNVLGGWE